MKLNEEEFIALIEYYRKKTESLTTEIATNKRELNIESRKTGTQ